MHYMRIIRSFAFRNAVFADWLTHTIWHLLMARTTVYDNSRQIRQLQLEASVLFPGVIYHLPVLVHRRIRHLHFLYSIITKNPENVCQSIYHRRTMRFRNPVWFCAIAYKSLVYQ